MRLDADLPGSLAGTFSKLFVDAPTVFTLVRSNTYFNSLSDEVVDDFVRSIFYQWASQNNYPIGEFGCVSPRSDVAAIKQSKDKLIEFAFLFKRQVKYLVY